MVIAQSCPSCDITSYVRFRNDIQLIVVLQLQLGINLINCTLYYSQICLIASCITEKLDN